MRCDRLLICPRLDTNSDVVRRDGADALESDLCQFRQDKPIIPATASIHALEHTVRKVLEVRTVDAKVEVIDRADGRLKPAL